MLSLVLMRATCIILLLIASLKSFSQKEYDKVKDVPDYLFCQIEQGTSTNLEEWRKFLEWGLMPGFSKIADSSSIPAGTYKIAFKFIVDKDGSLRDIVALQNDYGLGDLTVSVAIKYPKKWTPAEQNGKKVQSYRMQPVIFTVTDDDTEKETTTPPEIVKTDPALFEIIEEPIAPQPEHTDNFIAEKCIQDAKPLDEKAWLQYLQTEMEKAFKEILPAGRHIPAVDILIDKNGSITDAKIINDPGFGLAQRLKIIVMKYPGKWKPATLHARPIKSFYEQYFLYNVEANCATESSFIYY